MVEGKCLHEETEGPHGVGEEKVDDAPADRVQTGFFREPSHLPFDGLWRRLGEPGQLRLEGGQGGEGWRGQEVGDVALAAREGEGRAEIHARAPERLAGSLYPGQVHHVAARIRERAEAHDDLLQGAEGEPDPGEILRGQPDLQRRSRANPPRYLVPGNHAVILPPEAHVSEKTESFRS